MCLGRRGQGKENLGIWTDRVAGERRQREETDTDPTTNVQIEQMRLEIRHARVMAHALNRHDVTFEAASPLHVLGPSAIPVVKPRRVVDERVCGLVQRPQVQFRVLLNRRALRLDVLLEVDDVALDGRGVRFHVKGQDGRVGHFEDEKRPYLGHECVVFQAGIPEFRHPFEVVVAAVVRERRTLESEIETRDSRDVLEGYVIAPGA